MIECYDEVCPFHCHSEPFCSQDECLKYMNKDGLPEFNKIAERFYV